MGTACASGRQRHHLTYTCFLRQGTLFTPPSQLFSSVIRYRMKVAYNLSKLYLFQPTRTSQISANIKYKQVKSNLDFSGYAAILRDCAKSKNLSKGKQIHAELACLGLEPNTYISNLLISMYAKCGDIGEAAATFRKLHKRDVVSWNAMIAAYVQQGNCEIALQIFEQMLLKGVRPSRATFLSILGACISPAFLQSGRFIHQHITCHDLESDVAVGTALLNMYTKCGSLEDASEVFKKVPVQNVISWTSMISAYAQHGLGKVAMESFYRMQRDGVTPNEVTFVALLEAFSDPGALADAKEIHACIVDRGFESNLIVANALVKMYAKCGSLKDAQRMFDRAPDKDIISWTTLIAAYAQRGHCKKALALLMKMQENGFHPNKVTFLTMIDMCSDTSALAEGKLIHNQIIAKGFETDSVLGTALIHMYDQCGIPKHAQMVFDKVSERDRMCWNSIIAAYAHHGHGSEALSLLGQMQQEGVQPDNITFVSVLSACGHSGFVDYGVHFFDSITLYHAFVPATKHYACVIDLLGREGHLVEAEELINRLPTQSDATLWLTLLSACRIHGDLERAKRAAKRALEIEPQISSPYVVLSNVYATVGMWYKKDEVRELMMKRSVKKEPGCSMVEASESDLFGNT